MVIIRRIILIIVLLWLAFVFYRFFNPQWADSLIATLRWTTIISNIQNIQDQNVVSTWSDLSWNIFTWTISTWKIQTWIIVTWNVSTWVILTWVVNTWKIQTWLNKTLIQSSWETIWLVDTMDWFSEVIDTTTSTKIFKWDLNYKNSEYDFSISFPWSWDGYTIENYTWKDIKAQFVFSFDKKDYFILYVISNSYYNTNKSSQLNYLKYLAQDSTNTFAYKILETSDTKSKAIPYILKTFKSADSKTNLNIPTTITPTTVKVITKPTTVKKSTNSDWNFIKNIFDSFVK